ncbi:hypothetical protein O3G_MSEX007579 [Manduca sexta]|uniref:Serpin domain-containing protein n=2 Tax=Manduca sexta TaxID=7130 RepID=A0A921Z7Q1_MANSE|nr:hypothetical protein O3G_MSEX007579 [Manduca sexta]
MKFTAVLLPLLYNCINSCKMVNAILSIILIWNAIQFGLVCSDAKLPTFDSIRNRLALDALKAKSGQNAVVSTLFVKFPLCKLATVAVGEAKQELLSVLGYKSDGSIKTCYTEMKEVFDFLKQADLTLVNKMYVNYTNDIKPDFITNSSLLYGVQVEKVGFNYPSAAQSFINRWIETATYKRIKDVVDKKDIDKNTTMILVNAAHFKLSWEFPFDQRMTVNKKFTQYNKKKITIPMISKVDQFLYGDDEANDLRMLTYYLGAWGTAITYVMPNSAQDLPGFLDKLQKKPDLLAPSKKLMQWTRLKVFLPRLKIKSHVDWTEFLKLLGLKKIFNNASSGLEEILQKNSKTKNIWLSKVKQKVFVEMDEMGVARHDRHLPDQEYMQRIMMGPGINILEFAADRPFYFVISISLGSTSHDVFNGVYYGPELN